MIYKYEFLEDDCLWKDVCNKFNTHYCNGCCIRYMKMHYLVNNALLTKKQQHPDNLIPDEIDRLAFYSLFKIKENIVDYVKEGKNLFIYSNNNGNGKTQWSLKIMLKYFSKIWSSDGFTVRGLFINVTRLCNALKDGITKDIDYLNHIKDNIYTADLVIWDDIGLKSLTSFEHDYLYSYINARMESGKSNIFTSNLIGEDFRNFMGDRLYSRITGCDDIITLRGKDKRGVK